MMAYILPPPPPPVPADLIAAYKRRLRCFLPTNDDWGGSFFLDRQNRDHLVERAPMLCEAVLHAVPDFDRSKGAWHIKGWYITVSGTDDTELSKRFDDEASGQAGFLELLSIGEITMDDLHARGFCDGG